MSARVLARVTLLFILASARVTVCSATRTQAISVNDGGSDDLSCLTSNGVGACKSLQYVLANLPSAQQGSDSVTLRVSVSSNQTISGVLRANYLFTSHVKVVVSGIDRPFVLCEPNSTIILDVVKESIAHKIALQLKGLNIHGCGFLTHGNIPQPGLHFENFHAVDIQNCSIVMMTHVQLSNIHLVYISVNEFTQHTNMPTLVRDN